MSTIAYEKAPATEAAPAPKGVFRRIFDALIESRMQRARKEIALRRHLMPKELEQAGWRLTERNEDSLPFAR